VGRAQFRTHTICANYQFKSGEKKKSALITGSNLERKKNPQQIYKDVSEIYKDASTQQTSGEIIFGMS
jgi:hypothetical protein